MMDSATGLQVLVPKRTVVFVRIIWGYGFPSMLPLPDYSDLPSYIYPVFMVMAITSVKLAITPGLGGESRYVHICPTQMPFVNAIASTVY